MSKSIYKENNVSSYRKLSKSKKEYYNQIAKIEAELLRLLNKDFGDDKKYLNTISNTQIVNPMFWSIINYRNILMQYMNDIISNVTSANTIYIGSSYEYYRRRGFITEAIACCYKIETKLASSIILFKLDASKYINITNMLSELEESFKKWRQSDNATWKRIQEKQTN